jgi:hypothetical protein
MRHIPSAAWSIGADLAFWSLAGSVVTVLSGPLAGSWNAPRAALVAGGLGLVVAGLAGLVGLRRWMPLPLRVVRGFGFGNLALTPVLQAVDVGRQRVPARTSIRQLAEAYSLNAASLSISIILMTGTWAAVPVNPYTVR